MMSSVNSCIYLPKTMFWSLPLKLFDAVNHKHLLNILCIVDSKLGVFTFRQNHTGNFARIEVTVKPVLSSNSNRDKTKVLMTMTVESIIECSPVAA